MKDINSPVRESFHDTLTAAMLNYSDIPVPVSDEILNTSASYYVLLTNQTATPDETKTSFDANATINIDIVTKHGTYANKYIADAIANQVVNAIIPTPNRHNLTPPTQWQYLNVQLTGSTYITSLSDKSYIIRRILTFSLRVVQN